MKVTTQKLPRSLLALDIELDQEQFEKGLNQAAKRLSQKHTIPGFRKGKAPRYIIENYFGRDILIEEASNELINRSLEEALLQEQIKPVGQMTLESVDTSDTLSFRVTVPISPTVTLSDYHDIRLPLEIKPVSDEMVHRTMERLRDNHVVLQELEDPRPAQQGDQLTVKLETFQDGQLIDSPPEGEESPDKTLVLEPDRLVDELYEALLGARVGDQIEVTAVMPDDHHHEQIRGKDVTFKVQIVGIQGRLLPEWDELPHLENYEGTLDDLRAEQRHNLEQSARHDAEQKLFATFIEHLVAQTDYDIADATIHGVADSMLKEQEQELARVGVTLEQLLEYQGTTRDDVIENMLPEAEKRARTSLALSKLAEQEDITVSEKDVRAEIKTILQSYPLEERTRIRQMLTGPYRGEVERTVFDKKLRRRIVALATDTPEPEPEPDIDIDTDDEFDTDMPAASNPPAQPVPAPTETTETEEEEPPADNDSPASPTQVEP